MVASIVACGSFLAAEDAPGGPGSGDASADASPATAARRTAGSKRTPGQTARGTGASFAVSLLHADAEEAGEGDHACDGDAEAARRFGGETDLEPFASPSIKRSVSPSSPMPS